MLIAETITEEMLRLAGGILIVVLGLVALFVMELKSISRVMVLVIVLVSAAWVLMQLGVI
ncbi:MAG: hypothetical protein KJ928_00620 [Candidatus Altiarchaeota archaeon]|nr:hypothetical protein [Candidatus Altiarchaeota archaeon]MBU4437124.1 hypothetical protein [Candidatus Altiarchaeota archaeon]